MKDINGSISYKGKDYRLEFNLNVMERIQEEYGTVEKWGELTDGESGEPNAKAVIFGFTEMLNEGIDMDNEENGTDIPPLTPKQVGRMITQLGLGEVSEAMSDTVIKSIEDPEKNG